VSSAPPRSDATQFPGSLFATSPPNWAAWSSRKHIPVWAAVALACNLAPEAFEPFGPNSDQPIDGLFTPVDAVFKDRLTLASAAIANNYLRVRPTVNKPMIYGEVEMAHFTSWLRNIGHQTPEAFPWRADELQANRLQWPWGSHSTRYLELLARAADRFWKNYDPTDLSTAPKNEDVVHWLVGQGMAKRMAEVVATMLRAEDVRTGPR
jgi:hypothetical protein